MGKGSLNVVLGLKWQRKPQYARSKPSDIDRIKKVILCYAHSVIANLLISSTRERYVLGSVPIANCRFLVE